MGQTLSEPVTVKHTSVGEDDTMVYAISEMQGWRISMEDAHATLLNLDGNTGDAKASFFAVYDGHGGAEAAKYAATAVHEVLAKNEAYKEGNYVQALKEAFLNADEGFFSERNGDPSGCTATATLLVAGPAPKDAHQEKVARQIICANAGDSRTVLGLKGEAKPLSYDHKPGNKDESARIVAAGGFVEFGRVNGNLALSRALGDVEFKRNDSLSKEAQIVTADPEIIVHDITGEEEFLILACDGIWDCLSSQQVVDFVRREIAKGRELKDICEEAMDRCCAPDSEIGGVGCDNMTICIIALLNGRTKSEWYQWVKDRVDNKIGWDTPESIAPVFNSAPRQNNGGAAGSGLPGGLNSGNVLQALASGLAGVGGGQGGHGESGSGGHGGFRLAPGGLAAALGGGRFVLRPGEPDEKGEMTYEAHVVDEDDDSEDGDDEEEEDADGVADGDGDYQATQQGGRTTSNAAAAAAKSSEQEPANVDERPTLNHQPEIVETHSSSTSQGEEEQKKKAQLGGVGGGGGGESISASTNFKKFGSTEVSSSSSSSSNSASASALQDGDGRDGRDGSPNVPTKAHAPAQAHVVVRPSTEGSAAERQHAQHAQQAQAQGQEKGQAEGQDQGGEPMEL